MPKPLIPSTLKPEDFPLSEDYLAYQEEQSKLSSTQERVPYWEWIGQQLNLPQFPVGTTSVS